MDPGVPPWHSTPRGRPAAGMAPWSGGYLHRPVPLPRHSDSVPYYQTTAPKSEYQHWPDGWPETHHQHRPAAAARPESRAELYERGAYAYRPQSRQNYEEVYRAYPAAIPGEDYGGYYHTQSRAAPGDRDWWQEDFYRRPGHYWDPRYYGSHQAEQESAQFPSSDAIPYRTTSYEDRYLRTSGQERNSEETREESSVSQNELPSSAEPSLLQHYKESGLSSSSYELSQYIFDSPDPSAPKAWSPVAAEEALPTVPQSVATLKYSFPHVVVCFGAGGQMVRVCPNYPTEGQPAVIEIHSLEVILHDTPEQEEMRTFSGPLVREDLHKVDVIGFCRRKADLIQHSDAPRSGDVALLWQLLVLLCRQNGSMVGSDIADLLMQDCKLEKYRKQETNGYLINLSDESWSVLGADTSDLLTGEVSSFTDTAKQAMEKFTQLLFYGRKKEALDWAMRSHLWGHALFLSSKMDLRTYSWVMSRFTSSLAHNDPLQTLFQLMSGRIPQACTCCADEKWGDWRPHLAVILSNQVGDADLTCRSILVMGNTLATKGFVEASHCCYLTAGTPFGYYNVKKDPLVLLGSSHSKSFKAFATTEAIQRTEILEYCRQLGQAGTFIDSFQVYKLIYASRLADYGLTSQALHYCEGIGAAILGQSSGLVLLAELIKLAERLKFSDPCLQERPERGQPLEPDWLVKLRVQLRQLQVENKADTRQVDFLVKDGPTEGYVVHKEPSRHHQDVQGAARTEGDGHSQVPEYFTNHTEPEMGPSEPGIPQQLPAFKPGASVMPEVAGPALCYSWAEAHPAGHSHVTPTPQNSSRDVSPAIYQPPGGVALPGGPWQSHARLEHEVNTLAQQRMPMSRTRTVSECSTISVDEETAPPQDGCDRETTEQPDSPQGGDRAQEKGKKVSGSGWFSWFRSKSAKEEAALSPEAVPSCVPTLPSDPNPAAAQGTSAPLSLAPEAAFGSSLLLPPATTLLSQSGRNPFSRSAGNKDPSERQDCRSPLVSLGEKTPVPTFTPRGLPPLTPGGIPLYNPTQVPSAMGKTRNHPEKFSQRRYPTQS